jgi:2-amino-4-hydroxy-6-hydroxymethyldihydropteridine diphosphokinase
MKTAYIGIGSNIGEKLMNCKRALELVDEVPGCRVEKMSDFYRTEPIGVEGQDWYVNGVVSIVTKLEPVPLLEKLLAIESEMGRKRRKKWDSRIIDLDILLFGEDVINEENLTIPHPFMHLRKFVLIPMVQLTATKIHPILGLTMRELLEQIPEKEQSVIRIGEN